MYMFIYMYIYENMYIYIYIYIFIYIHTNTNTCTCTHAHTRTCKRISFYKYDNSNLTTAAKVIKKKATTKIKLTMRDMLRANERSSAVRFGNAVLLPKARNRSTRNTL